MTSWTLAEFVSIACTDRSAREAEHDDRRRFNLPGAHVEGEERVYKTRPAERRKVRGLVTKLRYAMEVLHTTVQSKQALSRSSSTNVVSAN